MTTNLMPKPPCTHGEDEDQTLVQSTLTPVQSSELFKGKKTVVIEHNGACYRLQNTKLGKLILTK